MALRHPILVGLTGGIGSGKSTVARVLRIMGYPVFDADSEVKSMYAEEKELRTALMAEFGVDIFSGLTLHAKLFAERMFNAPNGTQIVQQLIAPHLAQRFEVWRASHADKPIVFKEAAILIESGGYTSCDFIVQVTAPVEVRIARVIQRSGMQREEIIQRIESQMTDEERAAYCHDTLVNDNCLAILPQVQRLLASLNSNTSSEKRQ